MASLFDGEILFGGEMVKIELPHEVVTVDATAVLTKKINLRESA